METITNNFEVLHFPTIKRGKWVRAEGIVLSVTRTYNSKGGYSYTSIILSRKLADIVRSKGLTHVQLHREKYTGSLFMVFFSGGDDNRDAHIVDEMQTRKIEGASMRIYNRPLCDFLAGKMGYAKGESVRSAPLHLGDDLANCDDYATFKLNF